MPFNRLNGPTLINRKVASADVFLLEAYISTQVADFSTLNKMSVSQFFGRRGCARAATRGRRIDYALAE